VHEVTRCQQCQPCSHCCHCLLLLQHSTYRQAAPAVPLPRSQGPAQSLFPQESSQSRHNGPRHCCSIIAFSEICQSWTRSSASVSGNPILKSHQDQAGSVQLLHIQLLLKFCLGIRNVSSYFFISQRNPNPLSTHYLQLQSLSCLIDRTLSFHKADKPCSYYSHSLNFHNQVHSYHKAHIYFCYRSSLP